jgi:hypothetical protein
VSSSPAKQSSRTVGHGALDATFVAGMALARRIDVKVTRLHIFEKAGVMRGASGSAVATMAWVLSGIRTLKTPPKKAHAASHASMARAVVSSNVGYTNRSRPDGREDPRAKAALLAGER